VTKVVNSGDFNENLSLICYSWLSMWTPAVSQSIDQLTVEQTVCTDGAEGGLSTVCDKLL